MAEEREEETLVEEVEAWAEKISQLLLFLAVFLTVLDDFFGVSVGYPSLLACSWGGGEGWLKTSNSSVDSVRFTKLSSSCSSSSSSFT